MTTGRSARWRCRSGARPKEGDGENDSSESDHAAFWLTSAANGSSGFATIQDSGTSFKEAATATTRTSHEDLRSTEVEADPAACPFEGSEKLQHFLGRQPSLKSSLFGT